MRARLAHLWSSLWPDPATTSLGWWLVVIHLGLVLLVGGGISGYASGMLHDLADEQGKARVQLAATTAREDLRRMGEDALATARALADSPTLQRLTAEGQSDALPPFLRRSCQGGGVDACAVLSGKSVVAVSGPALDWQKILTASAEQTATFMALPATERVPLLGARAALGGAGMSVYVVRRLEQKLARALSGQVGAEIRLIDYRAYTSGPLSAFTPLYSAALADGHSAVQRIDSQDVYACAVPVFASSGEAIALIEALLPTSAVDAPTRHLVRKLLVTALILGALAVFAGLILGELVAGPVRALTAAATRLGAGGAQRHRRRGVRGRQEPPHPLPQSASRAAAGCDAKPSGRPFLRRGAAAAQRRRPAALRFPLPDRAGAQRGQRHGRRAPRCGAGRAAHRGDHQRRAGRRPAGTGDPRRDRARGGAPGPRLGARQHLARVPHAARRTAGVDRAAAGGSGAHAGGAAEGARDLIGAWHAASDAAHRQPARERTHRVRTTRHPPPERGARRGGGRRARPGAPAPGAAAPDPHGYPARGFAAAGGRQAASHPGVCQPARQRQQVRARGQHRAHRRRGAPGTGTRMGGG